MAVISSSDIEEFREWLEANTRAQVGEIFSFIHVFFMLRENAKLLSIFSKRYASDRDASFFLYLIFEAEGSCWKLFRKITVERHRKGLRKFCIQS